MSPRSAFSFAVGPAPYRILVHGGAGALAPERRAEHAEGCAQAAAAGARVLAAGGSALDAVAIAVAALENDPLFNAGRGACLDEDGRVRLDAAIMDGSSLAVGAVAALRPFANPVQIARRLLERGPHVFLVGSGANEFAAREGFAPLDEDALVTEAARATWEAWKADASAPTAWVGGTVGAVAKDVHGHVAAATSTGGKIGKGRGRVGDSPLAGAGTYADDERGACSTTGDGESMIRFALAARAVLGLRGYNGSVGALTESDAGCASSGNLGGARDLTRAVPRADERAVEVASYAERLLATLAARGVPSPARAHASGSRDAGAGGLLLVDRSGAAGVARSTATMGYAIVGPDGSFRGA